MEEEIYLEKVWDYNFISKKESSVL